MPERKIIIIITTVGVVSSREVLNNLLNVTKALKG
jgi:hypothetical protein